MTQVKRWLIKICKATVLAVGTIIYTLLDEAEERGNMVCKCKGCDERTAECHSTCEHYKKYWAENEKRKELKRQDQRKNIMPYKNTKQDHRWKW